MVIAWSESRGEPTPWNASAGECRSSEVRRLALGAALVLAGLPGCGTITAVSHDSKDEWFPGVNHDLALFGHVDPHDAPNDPISAACIAGCVGVPLVIEFALQVADVPLSFVADLLVMPFWTPAEPEVRGEGIHEAPVDRVLPGEPVDDHARGMDVR